MSQEIPLASDLDWTVGNEHAKFTADGLESGAQTTDCGRIEIHLEENDTQISSLLDELQRQTTHRRPSIPEDSDTRFPLRLNVVVHVVGSRGDVQPFVVLGRALKKHGHRVRLATHLVFRDFVRENGLEFFNIGGDPGEMMSFMVKNPNLIPTMKTVMNGEIGKRRKDVRTIIGGCWRSCIEAGEGIDMNSEEAAKAAPFVADAIIANPPSFAHINCAEKMGIPLHLMFTMPWSPTQAFPHPLANVRTTTAKPSVAKFASYAITEMIIWQGVGDLINEFRRFELGLEQLDSMRAPSLIHRLRIPFTYFWSPSLLPKPNDWQDHIDVTGFNFLPSDGKYVPPQDLIDFLEEGPTPIYIGFGSIVVDDPDILTQTLLNAVRATGQRALISKGWGGLGEDGLNAPDVYFLGNCPHDWLFPRVSCVIHHGGAGTTAIGLALGRPTVVVPFFGDQPFWGALVALNGAGPWPISNKKLTAERLADAIRFCLEPDTKAKALALSEKIQSEDGAQSALESFHRQLNLQKMRCALCPDLPAVWRVRRTGILLSAFAATILVEAKKLNPRDVKLYRAMKYDTNLDVRGPVFAGAEMFAGSITGFLSGIIEMPVNMAYDLAQPPALRFAENYGLWSPQACENTLITTATREDVLIPGTSESGPTNQHDENGIASSVSIASSKESHDTCSMAMKNNAFQTLVAGPSNTGRRVLDWVIQIPMSITFLLSQSFHYAPQWYHDRTVRDAPVASGVRSGIVAAGKEFGYSWYDGITGLVTQPQSGWKDSGATGMTKGMGKGIGGAFLKPQAGVWALLAYPLNGIHRAIALSYGENREDYVVKSRIRQGKKELQSASSDQRAAVLDRWKKNYEKMQWLREHARPRLIGLTLEDQSGGHTEDLATYVASRLRIEDPALVEELRPQLLGKAAGVSMWVALLSIFLTKSIDGVECL